MPRQKSVTSIDKQIKTQKERIASARARYDRLCQELADLQHERDKLMAQEIVTAMKKSGKTYRDIMTFLQAS